MDSTFVFRFVGSSVILLHGAYGFLKWSAKARASRAALADELSRAEPEDVQLLTMMANGDRRMRNFTFGEMVLGGALLAWLLI